MDFVTKMIARREARDQERARLQKRLLEINREAEEDEIALRVYQRIECGADEQGTTGEQRNTNLKRFLRPATVQTPTRILPPDVRVKDMIFAVLRDAKTGLTAKQIRGRAFLKFHTDINPNTLTVSLERLKERDLVRIEGREWFYVTAANPDVPQRIEAAAPGRASGLITEVGGSRPNTQTSVAAEKG